MIRSDSLATGDSRSPQVDLSGLSSTGEPPAWLPFFQEIVANTRLMADSLARIANHLAPDPGNIVGTPYVAERLGCTTVWVTEMIRNGVIPSSSLVPGTGNGKPWKFHRAQIDRWIESRR